MNTLRKIIALAAISLLFPLVGAADAVAGGNGGDASYTVTFENITTGQYLTPPNFALHDKSVEIFGVGQPASAGLQAVAENGGVPVLAGELATAIDAAGLGTSGVGAAAPLFPGDTSTVMVTATATRLSLASMVICTNDGFAGLDSRPLPVNDGQSRTYLVRAFDAGTEINTEMRSDLVGAPFCGPGMGSGASDPLLAENGVVKPHRTLRGVGDLDPSLDWQGPVMRVTVTRN